MKIIITGVTGFAGSHLAELALSFFDVEVYGTFRNRSRLENVGHLRPRLRLLECDLRDPFAVQGLIDQVQPDRVFHLAAQSFVPTSWTAPEETFTTNVLGQLHLFEALRRSAPRARIQIACSSEEYGLVLPDEVPIDEDNPLRPLSPYGVSKVAQDLLGYQYHASYGLHVVRTRAFNHTGPRRGEMFATSAFAKQIAESEAGIRPPVLLCGNLEARRDFTDVRDMVKAYWMSLESGAPGAVYVLASGVSYTIREVLELLLTRTHLKLEIKMDPTRMRPSDVPVLVGNPARFQAETGWKAEIPFAETLADLLDDWRRRVGSSPGRGDGFSPSPAPGPGRVGC